MSGSDRRNILHVDDDPEILRLVSRKLRGLNYNVISLQDPLQAIESMRINGCSVILLDIDMPVMNGLDLLQQIKKADGGMQVIMLSGLVSMSTLLQSMRWGAEACVFKPLKDFDELVLHIDNAFTKIEHWWTALRDLKAIKEQSALHAINASDR